MRHSSIGFLQYSLDMDVALRCVRQLVPPLVDTLHKGQCGRVGVVGGSHCYTGAPYYTAVSSLKTGGDLSWIFCPSPRSVTAIQSYSPELIVHAIGDYDDDTCFVDSMRLESMIHRLSNLLDSCRLSCLVVGPGLGRHPDLVTAIKSIVGDARQRGLPIVVDADGLYALCEEGPDSIVGYHRAVLTPNVAEFRRLEQMIHRRDANCPSMSVADLSTALGNIVVVKKGKVDVISDGRVTVEISTSGSRRRCGGQGDVLAGVIATFLGWSLRHENAIEGMSPVMAAAVASCAITRQAAAEAFLTTQRSMTTPDVIYHIGRVMAAVVPVE